MTLPSLDALRAEVLKLPREARADLLDALIASLDQDTALEAAWDEVAAQRDADLDSGAVVAAPLADVLARLEAKFPG
jgi:hypothetical protein